MDDSASNFPQGVMVFFRIIAGPDENGIPSLARSVHLTGRYVRIECRELSHRDDYTVFDEGGRLLGVYPREWVAAILPIVTVGPTAGAGSAN